MIAATEVISQAVELQTEVGVKCQELLIHGEAIPEDMAARMIEDKINSSEVAHHGKQKDKINSSEVAHHGKQKVQFHGTTFKFICTSIWPSG